MPEDAAIGTAVLYRQHPLASVVRTHTRSIPRRLPHGALVVFVEGRESAVSLCALELADAQLRLFQ